MVNFYKYLAHGCILESPFPIPELPEASDCPPNLRINLGEGLKPASAYGYRARPGGFQLWWNDIASFDILESGEINVVRHGDDDDLLRLAILGGALAVALQLQHRFIFHGNAVSVGDAGIVIVGAKGAGKSTLTAALVAQGHHLVSDDLATVQLDGQGDTMVYRGNLQLKLWPDSVRECFGREPEEFPAVFGDESKRRVPSLQTASVRISLPLWRIYVLRDGAQIAGFHLSTSDAWKEAMAHSYASRFGAELLRGAIAARHLEQCATLVRRVPFIRLERPRNFAKISEVVRWIEQDCASTKGPESGSSLKPDEVGPN